MQSDKLTWLLTHLKQCEVTKMTGRVTLSFYEGNLHPELEQTIKIVKQKS